MADIENLGLPEVKSQVKSLKVELKTWEHNFLQEKGRKPNKDDIVQDKVIAKKYKVYGKLKNRMSELSRLGGGDIAGSDEDVSQDVVTHVGSVSRSSALEAATKIRDTEKRRTADGTEITELKRVKSRRVRQSNLSETVTNEEGEVVTVNTFERPVKKNESVDEDGEMIDVDVPTEPNAVLKNPGLPFKSTHPLLSNLNFMPKEGEYTAPPLPQTEDEPPSPKKKAATGDAGSAVAVPIKMNKPLLDPEVFRRIPGGNVLRCKVVRQGENLDQLYPMFSLINEADEKFVLAARRRKKARYPHYIITTDPENLTKSSRGYVAKVKADASGLAFTILDARSFSLAKEKKGLRDMAAVVYAKGTMPHEMKVAIRLKTVSDNSMEPFTQDIMRDLITDSSQVLILKNKGTSVTGDGAHGLNFYGRVKVPSIKNFQLVDPVEGTVLLQFGRTGENSFILDAIYPFTPVEAFGIALTIFDAYDSL